MKNIRNFSIIAHIDHGKSTLADRLLEETRTIEKRRMREQYLDSMELERERGITIKMQPVRMSYQLGADSYQLNLIDTPGHIDFSYEVSRALRAVEGVLLLVDATKGIQAQTLSVLAMAQELKLKIITVINKIDLPAARVEEVKEEIRQVLPAITDDEILAVSAKLGTGVKELLLAIVTKIPPPAAHGAGVSGLVFDFEYSVHRGAIVYLRVVSGEIRAQDSLIFATTGEKFSPLEVGTFRPEMKAARALEAGEIGYVVTGLKGSTLAKVGETVTARSAPVAPIPGYRAPAPVVWASVYPSSQDDFPALKLALERLRLGDAAISYEEESSGALGRGFRIGFLGMLHLEITTERLRREFDLDLVIATPSVAYEVEGHRSQPELIYSPPHFPEETKNLKVREPWVEAQIIAPALYLNVLIKLLTEHEADFGDVENWSGGRMMVNAAMPLRELMRGFFDELKSVSAGFASLSYRLVDYRPAQVLRLDVLINEEVIPAFSRVVAERRVERDAEKVVARLKELLPRQLIRIKIQARAAGRIIRADSIAPLKKDVTGYLYGGDITRKMKLREKQKKGKKKMQARGSVTIPGPVFLKMVDTRSENK